ncbi:hypothetical protein E2P76_15695 [Lactiplantibacillus plantarum]|nr:hypothetical protein E2P76_15695 [Lactiplantibacillus plantarum]
MNNQDFDLGTVKHFFDHDYHDRGMVKWQGFYLSDHTAALHQQAAQIEGPPPTGNYNSYLGLSGG